MNRVRIATWTEVADRVPTAASVEGVDLVVIRRGDEHSVLYGRCLHRGALLADGTVQDDDLICGLHGWDYRIESGVSAYNNAEVLEKFTSVLDGDGLYVDRDEVIGWKLRHPQPYSPDVYQGLYKDPHGVIEEPYVMQIHELGFGQYLAEMTTAVKYGMNITHVLLNNSQLGKITKEQRAGEWDVWQTSLHNPEFAAYATVVRRSR